MELLHAATALPMKKKIYRCQPIADNPKCPT